MKNQEFIELCIKKITGNIDDAGLTKFDKWINESNDNQKEYEKLKFLWENTGADNLPKLPDIDDEWYSLTERIGLYEFEQKEETLLSKTKSFFNSIFTAHLKPVSAFASVVLITIIGLYLFNNASQDYQLTEVITQNAATEKLVLPDGSTVTLNSGSKIKFSDPFKEDARLVEIEGEAFFSVIKGEIPFIIKTENAKVRVLGTEFNVWSREAKTKVIVKSGKVELSSELKYPEEVILTGNQLSTVFADQPPSKPKSIDSDFLLGWLNSELVFDKTHIAEILNELERHYDISLSLEDRSLRKNTLTGSFKNENPDSALNMICLALDLTYSKEGNNYIIKQQ